MAERNINVQYKLRGDTLANLEAKNAVYADREPVMVMALLCLMTCLISPL